MESLTEARMWHPVAQSTALQAAPLGVQLLGQSVVLWRDDAGTAHAWADQCPHRGAKLSLGRVCAGHLECPYHGWQFAADGACVKVPALPGFVRCEGLGLQDKGRNLAAYRVSGRRTRFVPLDVQPSRHSWL